MLKTYNDFCEIMGGSLDYRFDPEDSWCDDYFWLKHKLYACYALSKIPVFRTLSLCNIPAFKADPDYILDYIIEGMYDYIGDVCKAFKSLGFTIEDWDCASYLDAQPFKDFPEFDEWVHCFFEQYTSSDCAYELFVLSYPIADVDLDSASLAGQVVRDILEKGCLLPMYAYSHYDGYIVKDGVLYMACMIGSDNVTILDVLTFDVFSVIYAYYFDEAIAALGGGLNERKIAAC